MKLQSLIAPLRTAKFWKELSIMTVGMFIAAASVYYFLVPSKIVVGSISGLSIVISALFENAGIAIKVSTVVLIINAILLVLAYFLIGKEFGIKTCYTALILGPMMDLWEKICPNERLIAAGTTSVMGDLWFDLICFVLILSMSQAIMFRINASTGGLDILAKIVNKYFHFDIGLSVTIAGVVICCTAFFVNPFRLVIIGLIGTWINGLIVDYFMASLSRRKRVYGRKALEPALPASVYTLYLRLLQHDLTDPDLVGIGRATPGKVAVEQPSLAQHKLSECGERLRVKS